MSASDSPKRHAARVVRALKRAYPDAACALVHGDAFQLLIATILSAQCTDQRVNLVTKQLFRRYQTPADFAKMRLSTLEKLIQSTGFFRNKAKNIKACCQMLVKEFDGQVPDELDDLVQLPGVGRKTANVVLGNVWNEPDGVVVDTHVTRISRKLALTNEENAEKIERDLNRLIDREDWVMFSHWLIWHGRRVCKARNPLCEDCQLYAYCPTRA